MPNENMQHTTDPASDPRPSAVWTKPRPQTVPGPTFAPAVVALAIVCLLWGLLTTYLMSILGLLLLAVGLAIWIGGYRHERG